LAQSALSVPNSGRPAATLLQLEDQPQQLPLSAAAATVAGDKAIQKPPPSNTRNGKRALERGETRAAKVQKVQKSGQQLGHKRLIPVAETGSFTGCEISLRDPSKRLPWGCDFVRCIKHFEKFQRGRRTCNTCCRAT